MTSVIHTQELSRRFGRTLALDCVDLNVAEGSVYALVGANGAGKTTLIKILMNIFAPTAGQAQVLGVNSRKGYVSENQEMPDWMTPADMLAYWRNFYPTWDRDLEQSLVGQLGFPLDRKLAGRTQTSLTIPNFRLPELALGDQYFGRIGN